MADGIFRVRTHIEQGDEQGDALFTHAAQPTTARLRIQLSHTVMGLGFYLTASLFAVIGPL